MKENSLKRLEQFGQSIWLDYLQRELITSGRLRRLILEDGLQGITSNPSIFEKAIIDSHDYDEEIKRLQDENIEVSKIYSILTRADIQAAADEFHDVYYKTQARDGYVSLEVNPHLAHDTEATIAEARQLWKALNRPNVFIKVPATKEGLPAITQLISEGININVTLLFGLTRYQEVHKAYMKGLEIRVSKGEPVDSIASVASFFLSRIDVLLDPLLEKIIAENTEKAKLAQAALGQVAIASAKIAYQLYNEAIASDRFANLAAKGAQVQRLLWASTSTKNPQYSDIKYVEALIGKDTINTMPMETLTAYRDHGSPQLELESNLDNAYTIFQQLPELGIHLDTVTQQLEDEGINKFVKSFDQLLAAIKKP